jgi:hypothetical protein
MVRSHRLVVGLLVLATLGMPTQAQGAFGVQGRFDLVAPSGAAPGGVRDLAVDVGGSVYVLWPGLVQKYAASGALVESWGGHGTAPGQFFPPDQWGRSTDEIEVDGLGHVFVTDYYGNRVVEFTTGGDFVANRGANGGDGTAGRGPGEFYRPAQLATDVTGNLYVIDSPQFQPLSAPQVQKLAPDGTALARRSAGFLPAFCGA